MDAIDLIRKIKRDVEKKKTRNVAIQASKRMQDVPLGNTKITTKTQSGRSLDEIITSLDKLEKKAERDEAFKRKLESAISKQNEKLDDIGDKLDQLIDDWNNL